MFFVICNIMFISFSGSMRSYHGPRAFAMLQNKNRPMERSLIGRTTRFTFVSFRCVSFRFDRFIGSLTVQFKRGQNLL